ncbi:MAG TPA: nucleotidyltransferase family protein [Candidatus Avacidaminococcus intestinavium]|uniref:Nucleotidyltransferase family protein n=1 Tax=Candidatus Avacidaminococcus intestinavium TaxID=2840684 RepID=A0A9D1SM29_9FIRM|nr:nucleotidyltransferase family protein [Candidatus Avacidaminococcus intestinavium]
MEKQRQKTFEVIILAGGNCKWLEMMGLNSCKAMAQLGGKPLISYMIEALQKSAFIAGITIVGPREALQALNCSNEVKIVDAAGGSMLDNALTALQATKVSGEVLFVTDDIPLLTTEAVEDFLQRTQGEVADVFYPIISQDSCLQQFPRVKRTLVKLKDGIFTGGNIFLVQSSVVASCKAGAEEVFARRKAPVALCKWLGWSFVLKFLLRRLTVADIEERVSVLLGFKGKAIITEYAEIGMDIDKESDWVFVSEHFKHSAAHKTMSSKRC